MMRKPKTVAALKMQSLKAQCKTRREAKNPLNTYQTVYQKLRVGSKEPEDRGKSDKTKGSVDGGAWRSRNGKGPRLWLRVGAFSEAAVSPVDRSATSGSNEAARVMF